MAGEPVRKGMPYMERRLSRALFLTYRNLGNFVNGQGTVATIDAHGYVINPITYRRGVCVARFDRKGYPRASICETSNEYDSHAFLYLQA